MSWLDGSEKVIRGETYRQVELKVNQFHLDKDKLGEEWEEDEAGIQCGGGRFLTKRFHIVLRRTKKGS